jgi:hypothetical protein
MKPRSSNIGRLRPLAVCALATAAMLSSSGCAPHMLQHVGYTSNNKVWYHWVHGQTSHTMVVCDVLPNGSEINCRESSI